MNQNHQFKLTSRPVGAVKRSDFSYTQEPVRDPADGEVVIKNLYISLDPAMRGWMNESKNSYIPPVAIGEVMRALAVGRVVASKNPQFTVGDHVGGMLGMQEYAYSNGQGLNKVDPRMAPLPVFLGTLGMPGLTAYFGLLDVGKPKEGETVVVSGAAGAVGAVVGQIAKIKGCRVIGIAGGAEKCRYLVEELGFDAAIDYKKEDVKAALHQHCPQGIDVYFDNVGGEILDAVLTRLARNARIVICGAISQYNNTTAVQGPANYLSLIVARASMQGIMVADYYPRAMEALSAMGGWLASGKLKSREDIVDGLETFPDTFLKLFSGENNGKLVLKVAEA
ncbi:NADP-dependent oxidoreductase [Solimicrobium silvestre]|uniref:Putative NADP-dependent oxidoreductase n=1 Tax=Solimicrobium silvestre TaxID=2099400 RepID=A0A2S9H4M9_9BURK|nr:NADP-dependent oxidoreductase [Solimicrobium silvestre]PRC94918.1 putative NADP-dependent oxidoreductase [Solimicrobium silvestre]